MQTKTELENLQDKMKDLLAHPKEDLSYMANIRNEMNFSDIELRDLQSAFSKLLGNDNLSESDKVRLVTESWRVSYTEKPPTVSEFLSPAWIGGTSDSLFPYMKTIMEEFFDPSSLYRNLILHLPIGFGKSMLSMLILVYISVYYSLLRNPKQYLNQASHATVVIAILAVTQAKAEEITTRPLLNLLGNSEKFLKCRREDQMESYQLENPNKICYTTASTKGSMFRISDLYFKQVSQISDLLGLNILSSTATELTFFSEVPGWNDQKIMRVFNDLKGRMYSRFQGHYLSRSILDSSPNTMESDITKYIVNEAPKSKQNYILEGTKWEWQPFQFPIWEKDKTQTFPVFVGTESTPPKILKEHEKDNYDHTQILDVPNDIRTLADDDLLKVIKDYGGRPSASADKLVNLNHIEPIFSPQLKNIYTFIHAPANLPPEGLIWNRIKDTFFYKTQNGKYEFYRNPNAVRYVSVDQSYSNNGDATGIAVSHVEMNKKGELIYVTDMTICIVATKEQISLEAIKFFIRDLRKEGTMKIAKVSFDQFQSQTTIQYLKNHGFDVERLSVDSSTEPYLNYLALMSRGACKMGRNLIFKNNLKSLLLTKTKTGLPRVDHSKGDVPYDENDKDWNTSKMGYNAKDCSDAVVGSVYLCDQYGSKAPSYIWEEAETKEEIEGLRAKKLNEVLLKNYAMKRKK